MLLRLVDECHALALGCRCRVTIMVRAAANGFDGGTPPSPGTPFLIDQSDREPPRHGLQDLDCGRTLRPPGRAARPRIDRGNEDVSGGGAAREPPLPAAVPAAPCVLVA